MNPFKRKNRAAKEEEAPQETLFTQEMLAKRLLWDIVPCEDVPGMLPLMNLSPDSDEVAEMEHKASHTRLDAVVPMGSVLRLLVPITSAITASAMLVNSGNEVGSEEALAFRNHHHQILAVGITAVLASLIDMGVIMHVGGEVHERELLG